MARQREQGDEFAPLVKQLEDLKRLTILQLLASGIPSAYVAKALGVHSSVISRMMPVREIQKLAAKRSDQGT